MCSTHRQCFLEDEHVSLSVSLTHFAVQDWIDKGVDKREKSDHDDVRVLDLPYRHTVEVDQLGRDELQVLDAVH